MKPKTLPVADERPRAANRNLDGDETLFSEALAQPPALRRAFVESRCGEDNAAAGRVMALLEGYEKNSTFLEVPAPASAPMSERDLALPPDPGPGDWIGRYRLLERIGEGGFGLVYIAEQHEPVRRRVALKLIRLGLDTREFIARFEAERQALALMDHPGIARVFDAGATEHGRPYLVMELIRGTPITRYCDDNTLSLPARLELFARVCVAVQHAHQKGVIHRDLKPSNILVTVENDTAAAGQPKIIDFGIAKAISSPLTEKTLFTRTDALIGTPAYTSPEQMELGVRDVDTRADIYSLGVLLYELLTGCLPFDRARFQHASFDEKRRIVREVEPLRPSERVKALADEERAVISERRGVDPGKLSGLLRSDLDWIAERCLEKDRSRRYETANALAMDIRRHLENEPVVARPASRTYRMRKFVHKHRPAVIAAAAVAVSLVGGLIAAGVSLVREKAAASKSRQVAQFMKDMLGSVGPSVARGRDTTLLREVLDTNIRRLDTDLRDQPEVAADLRHTLGIAFREIGEYDSAAKLWREAIGARRTLGDKGSVELAATLHELGSLLWWINEPAEADRALTEALAIREKTLGPDHFDVGTTLAAIAYNLGSHRPAGERETLLRRAEAIHRKHPGHNDDELAQTLMILGFVLSSDDRRDEAGALLRESVDIRRQLFGGPHPHLAESLHMLFRAGYPLLRSPDEYRPDVRQSQRERLLVVREVRGLANAKLVAAFLDFTAGRIPPETLTEDLQLVHDVFADLCNVLPADSPDLAVAQLAFASALELAPDSSSEAQSRARDAINRLDRARENDRWPHRDIAPAMQYFVFRAWAVGRPDYAVAMGEALKADVRFGSILTYGPPITRSLGYTYHDLGRDAEAVPLLEATVLPERSPWRPLWRSVGRAHLFLDTALLGDSYRKLGRIEDSRSILEAGLVRKIGTGDSAQGARAAVRGELAYTAMAEGKFAEAEALFRVALKEYESRPPQNAWEHSRPHGRVVSGLGQALAGQGKFAEAEGLLIDGFSDLIAKRKTFWGDPTAMLREAGEAVVQFYRAWGKPDQAAEWEARRAEL